MNPIRDRLVEIKRANGRTEYVETNQLKFELHPYHIKTCEIVEKYNADFKILESEIFTSGLIKVDFIQIFTLLTSSYNRLYKEIKDLTLLDATTKQIEREYTLRTVLSHFMRKCPWIFRDLSLLGTPLSAAAEDLLSQLGDVIPALHPGNRQQTVIFPYQRRSPYIQQFEIRQKDASNERLEGIPEEN